MNRLLTYAQALQEAQDLCLEIHPEVFLMGLGVPDPKGIFGSTLGLQKKYGGTRVFDIPLSENAMTGIALGAAITGMRPILTHQRVDFALTAMEQLVNQAAKWHYMFGGTMHAPMVIRMIIGRGWGQGPQHSQSLQSWFAHIPGLKVVMPVTPHDAKGLLIQSVEDDNPVIFIEHRWLYNITGNVPQEIYRVPLGKARIASEGNDVTIVSTSYMTIEALRAAELLAEGGVSAEVVDVRSLRPLDEDTILDSIKKTGRLIVADTGWKSLGFSAEIVALVSEKCHEKLKSAPVRIASPDVPSPTSSALSNRFYPRAVEIVAAARSMMGLDEGIFNQGNEIIPLDIPDITFKGPF